MFPGQFDYRRAGSLGEALDLLADDGDREVRPIAGGHGIVPDMKAGEASPDVLVDVSGIDGLAGVDAHDGPDADDGTVTIGALTTHADLAASDLLADRAPALASAAEQVADVQVRNRGTIGGNLAEADPAADLPAAVLAADASIRARGPEGERSIPAAEFFRGEGETALAGDELVTAVAVPSHPAGAYVKKTHPSTGYAMVGVAAVADVEAGAETDVRVAVNGVADRAVRLPAVEEAVVDAGPLDGDDDESDIAEAAGRAGESLDPDRRIGDPHASAAFRASVLDSYVERALSSAIDAAIDRATDGGDAA